MNPALQSLATPSIETHALAALPDSLRNAWNLVFDARESAEFHHHPDWLAAVDRHLLDGRIRIACANDANGPLAILPLVGSPDAREIRLPQHAHIARCDALIHPRVPVAEVNGLVTTLLQQAAPGANVWRIADLPQDAALAHSLGLPDAEAPSGWSCRPSRSSAWFSLDREGPSPVPGKLRRNLARLRRRLESQGDLRVERVREPARLPDAWSRFLSVEASGWKGDEASGTAIANDPSLERFYAALLDGKTPGMGAVIDLLTLDGACIAAQFGLQTHDTQWLLKIGYDEEHAAAAPGSLLLEASLRQAADEGLQRLSLVTSPEWASRWHPQEQQLWHAVRYTEALGGRRHRALDEMRGFARQHLRR